MQVAGGPKRVPEDSLQKDRLPEIRNRRKKGRFEGFAQRQENLLQTLWNIDPSRRHLNLLGTPDTICGIQNERGVYLPVFQVLALYIFSQRRSDISKVLCSIRPAAYAGWEWPK